MKQTILFGVFLILCGFTTLCASEVAILHIGTETKAKEDYNCTLTENEVLENKTYLYAELEMTLNSFHLQKNASLTSCFTSEGEKLDCILKEPLQINTHVRHYICTHLDECQSESSSKCMSSPLKHLLGRVCADNYRYMCNKAGSITCSQCCEDFVYDEITNMCIRCPVGQGTTGRGVPRSCRFKTELAPASVSTMPTTVPTTEPTSATTDPPTTFQPVPTPPTVENTPSKAPIPVSPKEKVCKAVHLVVVKILADTVLLKWRCLGGRNAEKYIIHWNSTFEEEDKVILRDQQVLLDHLTPDRSYDVAVASVDDEDFPFWTPKRTFRTTKKAPSQAVYIDKVQREAGNWTFSWKPIDDQPLDEEPILGYKVRYWKFGLSSTSAKVLTTRRNEISFALPSTEDYLVDVTPYSRNGNGHYSTPQFVAASSISAKEDDLPPPSDTRDVGIACAVYFVLVICFIVFARRYF